MTRKLVLALSVGLWVCAACKGRPSNGLKAEPPVFAGQPYDFYILNLSWSPEFCFSHSESPECGTHPGFVVHGLWPQNEHGRGPEHCTPARPVAANLVAKMLDYIPSSSLIQHEWATHGTCSGLSAAEYFAILQRLRDSIRIPQAYEEIERPLTVPPRDVENQFSAANPGIPFDGFRVSCYSDGALQEVRICFDKSLTARPCTGVQDCTRMSVALAPTGPRR